MSILFCTCVCLVVTNKLIWLIELCKQWHLTVNHLHGLVQNADVVSKLEGHSEQNDETHPDQVERQTLETSTAVSNRCFSSYYISRQMLFLNCGYTKRCWNNFEIISVFYFTCNHVWKTEIELFQPVKWFRNHFKIISATLKMSKNIHKVKFVLWNNFQIISGKVSTHWNKTSNVVLIQIAYSVHHVNRRS